jgi:molybdate transport system permease protein
MPASRFQAPVEGAASRLFRGILIGIVALFVAGFVVLFAVDVTYVRWADVREVVVSPGIRASLWLSIWTSLTTVVLGLLVAVPVGYALSRYRFPGRAFAEMMVDLPILLPPLVLGLSLLLFFSKTWVGRVIDGSLIPFAFHPNGIILCQFLMSASLGIRAAKIAFDGVDPRLEHVAMTLGCGRAGAFRHVALPLARRGIVAGGILIWARAFGIFGPLFIFVGAVRMRTEVLSTTIQLEQSSGRDEVAMAVALLMLAISAVTLVAVHLLARRYDRR